MLRITSHQNDSLNEINNILNIAKKVPLKPLERAKSKSNKLIDPHKRLIDQVVNNKKFAMVNMETSTNTFNANQQSEYLKSNGKSNENKLNKTLTMLDDKEFRKTIRISEKIEINCEPNRENDKNELKNSTTSISNLMSKSLVDFGRPCDENARIESENMLNNLVRNQLILEFCEINDFLDGIGMTKYIDVFLHNGINTLDKLKSGKMIYNIVIVVNEEKFKQLDILPGHRIKIKKKLKESEEYPVGNNNIKQVSHNNYDILPAGNEADDEAEQRRLFQQAVENFRKGGNRDSEMEAEERRQAKLFQSAVENFRKETTSTINAPSHEDSVQREAELFKNAVEEFRRGIVTVPDKVFNSF
jgi:hypothetical protein